MSPSRVFYVAHASAKSVNCTACGNGIVCLSIIASASRTVSVSSSRSTSAHKIACARKSTLRLILLIRSFAISTC